ncbi:hypothetical protein AWB76_02303 [Caballeronia temeraria]|uniref:Uncharacterized protein n=1 Tax=Caballeronia temeraria TaxID=1777137 RepID=A0A158AFN1_9BURK|nr:hypothetical protein AWB76_02303 [Caballeronia temeraria]
MSNLPVGRSSVRPLAPKRRRAWHRARSHEELVEEAATKPDIEPCVRLNDVRRADSRVRQQIALPTDRRRRARDPNNPWLRRPADRTIRCSRTYGCRGPCLQARHRPAASRIRLLWSSRCVSQVRVKRIDAVGRHFRHLAANRLSRAKRPRRIAFVHVAFVAAEAMSDSRSALGTFVSNRSSALGDPASAPPLRLLEPGSGMRRVATFASHRSFCSVRSACCSDTCTR